MGAANLTVQLSDGWPNSRSEMGFGPGLDSFPQFAIAGEKKSTSLSMNQLLSTDDGEGGKNGYSIIMC